MEVFPKVITCEEDFTFTLVWTIGRRDLSKANLIIVVELSKVIEGSIKVKAKWHVAGNLGILILEAHRTLNYVVCDGDRKDLSLVQVTLNLSSNI